MWECPDFVPLNGADMFIVSPQEADGISFEATDSAIIDVEKYSIDL